MLPLLTTLLAVARAELDPDITMPGSAGGFGVYVLNSAHADPSQRVLRGIIVATGSFDGSAPVAADGTAWQENTLYWFWHQKPENAGSEYTGIQTLEELCSGEFRARPRQSNMLLFGTNLTTEVLNSATTSQNNCTPGKAKFTVSLDTLQDPGLWGPGAVPEGSTIADSKILSDTVCTVERNENGTSQFGQYYTLHYQNSVDPGANKDNVGYVCYGKDGDGQHAFAVFARLTQGDSALPLWMRETSQANNQYLLTLPPTPSPSSGESVAYSEGFFRLDLTTHPEGWVDMYGEPLPGEENLTGSRAYGVTSLDQ